LKLPLNALGFLVVTNFLLSIIYLVPTTAFNAIVSLQTMALNVSYIPPILFIMLRKIRGQHIAYGTFKLGRFFGIAVNLVAVLILSFIVIWMPFPTILPVTGSNMNYAGLVFGIVVIGALLDWIISGHKRFEMPVIQNL
jgi:choline transport protein